MDKHEKRLYLVIKDKMTENHAKILELIKSQYNGLFKDVKEIEDED